MNKRENLTKHFSGRLIKLLIQNGYASSSASTGVKVKELAGKAGCSFEMARRYTNGNALPDPLSIIKIAEWLKVDPGWLLFGTQEERTASGDDPLVLTKSDIKLLLEKIMPVYCLQKIQHTQNLHDFFADVIADFARLHGPLDLKIKILQTSISSALHFLPHLGEN